MVTSGHLVYFPGVARVAGSRAFLVLETCVPIVSLCVQSTHPFAIKTATQLTVIYRDDVNVNCHSRSSSHRKPTDRTAVALLQCKLASFLQLN